MLVKFIRQFKLNSTSKFYLLSIILILIPTVVLTIIAFKISYSATIAEIRMQMMEAAITLEQQFDIKYSSIEDIIIKQGVDSSSRAKQILLLNEELQPMVDNVSSKINGDIHIGFFWAEEQSIIACGPECDDYSPKRWSLDSPVFESYKTGMPAFIDRIDSSYLGHENISLYTLPIYNNNTIDGHIWVAYNTDKVSHIAHREAGKIAFIGLFIGVIFISLSYLLSIYFRTNIAAFANSVLNNDTDNNNKYMCIPELQPLVIAIETKTTELSKSYQLLFAEFQKNIQTLNELKESEQRFNTIFYNGPNLLFIVDINSKLCLDCNKNFTLKIGYTKEDIIEKSIYDLEVFKAADIDKIFSIINGNGKITNLEISYRHQNNKSHYGLLSTEFLTIDNKSCLFMVINDITERKLFREQLEKIDKLKLIDKLAGAMGHEIRNPMTTVRGFIQLLSTKNELQPYKHYFTLIISELDRANGIITEYLSLAKSTPITLTKANLNTIINNLFPLIQADAFARDMQIKLDLHEISDINLNEQELRQLILNIVQNGLEAMNTGGLLTIHTELINDKVCLKIIDQGKGIPANVLNQLGTPFVTTKDKGTGLGMSVCYAIAGRHKAKIYIRSSESNGTEITISFPTDQSTTQST